MQVAVILREVSARMDGRALALVTDEELGHARRVILMGSVSGTTIGLSILGTSFTLAILLWTAGSIAAWVTGTTPPTASRPDSLGILARPAGPATILGATGLHPVAHWVALAVQIVVVAALAWGGWRIVGRRPGSRDPQNIDGITTRPEVARAASARALTRSATPPPDHCRRGDLAT